MKKYIIPLVVVVVILIGGLVYLYINLDKQKKDNKEMQQLADLDKKEMMNEYQQFASQYSEMKTQINNDSIVAQLTNEQLKTQHLLAELRNVKSTDAAEITRLKRELATVRAVMRGFILEIDSLNRLNKNLTNENIRVKGQYQEATKQIEGLNTEKQSLTEKMQIAAQLDATGIQMVVKNKRGKVAKKMKDAKSLQVSFSIVKNITASAGMRTTYVRITTPTGNVLSAGGTFPYENKQLDYSIKKTIEYNGEEQSVTTYWNVSEFLSGGTYRVNIFADGNMIGSQNFVFE